MSTASESAETEHAEEAGDSGLSPVLRLAPASTPTEPVASANLAACAPAVGQARRRRTRGKGRRIHYA